MFKHNTQLIFSILLIFTVNVIAGQSFSTISFSAGPAICTQNKTPEHFADGGMTIGFAFSTQPTFLIFGTKKQFDLNAEIAFIRKGSYNYSPVFTYTQSGQPGGVGSETYKVTIDYLSFSPTIKMHLTSLFFIKAGPRMDAFLNFETRDITSSDPRTKKDFNTVTYGISYGFGISTGKKKVNFICELVGQNDFSKSSFNAASGQTFRNNCYLMAAGITIHLRQEE